MIAAPLDGGCIWPDQQIERRVNALIAAGGVKLPRWGWAMPGPYNGATGHERIAGWKKLHVARQQGWLGWPRNCVICGRGQNFHHHTENYFRPLFAISVCRSCHFRLHRRFADPIGWEKVVEISVGDVADRLPRRELTRTSAVIAAASVEPF